MKPTRRRYRVFFLLFLFNLIAYVGSIISTYAHRKEENKYPSATGDKPNS